MQRDDWDMTDALIRALDLARYAPLPPRSRTLPPVGQESKHKKRGRPRSTRTPYVPTLPGVTYDAHFGVLRSRVYKTVNGKKRQFSLGQGKPTPEEELRLHLAWEAKRAELAILD